MEPRVGDDDQNTCCMNCQNQNDDFNLPIKDYLIFC